ncbi:MULTISPECIES: cell wall metabolism sensor histidine kinase WalK [unclassified Saccharopolyspora]|uniref:sensor histidine kinase n=1 Tax=unclassified Saccharopolyspora TaxID=2646250 RepID=UPI001CD7D3D5|nr:MULTISPECIES: HAMP domain-containing sensor histidine kinase [unclassified Saccharopolyspora]MCA1186115.1 HAMP domain-containing histidine kinase [Saccharopolyspora sp. 6T]MCA1279041.1 HAMP domain-containing histidine kinase [Saccharopolyspora sp. 7B]
MGRPAVPPGLRPLIRRGPGLRARLTLLATGLVAAVSALLLWLGWLLVGNVVAGVPRLPPGGLVRVGEALVPAEQLGAALRASARHQVLTAGGVAFVAVVLAAAVLAWTVTGRVLRPLQEVTDSARRLSAESLDERIALGGPRDEVAELADTFDAMLDRLQAAFDSQRRFVANASHELRTPLAVIRTELDVTLSDPDADAEELRRMAEVLREAAARAERLVEALLLLARTDGAELAERERVDLHEVAVRARRGVEAEAQARSVRITCHGEPVFVLGDPALLERIAENLLENAVRHNVDGGWVEVVTTIAGRSALLRVSSSGPLIDPDQVDALFAPFRRAGVQRTARTGAGLGLSIVRAAVTAHGGRVTARSVPNGGLDVCVELPVDV